MLRQEVGWFDQSCNSTGALTARLTDAAEIKGVSIQLYIPPHLCDIHAYANIDYRNQTGSFLSNCFLPRLHSCSFISFQLGAGSSSDSYISLHVPKLCRPV